MIHQFDTYLSSSAHEVDYYFLTTDMSNEVKDKISLVPYLEYDNNDPWSVVAANSKTDAVVLIQPTVALSPGWLDNLASCFDEDAIINCSVIVPQDSNFGDTIIGFRETAFCKFAKMIRSVRSNRAIRFPCLCHRKNIVDGAPKARLTITEPTSIVYQISEGEANE
jgi:hypothetical protein